MTYNQELITRQGLTKEDIAQLDILYANLKEVFDRASESTDSKELACLSIKVEEIEFELQKAWKFEQNIAMHSYWNKIPNCDCPYYDNRDLFGTGKRIYNQSCPVHGHLITHADKSKMRH